MKQIIKLSILSAIACASAGLAFAKSVSKNWTFLELNEQLRNIQNFETPFRYQLLYGGTIDNEFDLPKLSCNDAWSLMAAGESARGQGDIETAMAYYRQAKNLGFKTEALPISPANYFSTWRTKSLENGTILLDNFDSHLTLSDRFITDNNVEQITKRERDGTVVIEFENTLDFRDKLAFNIFPNPYRIKLPPTYDHLLVRAKVSHGSFLSIATVVDDNRERPISYFEGNDQWETFEVPIKGDILRQVKIVLSEPGNQRNSVLHYKTELDWMVVATCSLS